MADSPRGSPKRQASMMVAHNEPLSAGDPLPAAGEYAPLPYDSGDNTESVLTWTWFLYHFKKERARWQLRRATWTWGDWLAYWIPCVGWLRTYKHSWLINDLIAGISVGFMVVPQGMSYAATAGVPSVYGLYGAFLPCMVYGIIGSSRQLAVGPVAVTSLLISTKLEELLPCHKSITNYNTLKPEQVACQDQYNHAAIQLAFIVACLYTGIGILRLGWITKFLSHPVIGGFTSGAAITIGIGQFKYIVGYNVKPANERLNLYLSQYLDRIYELKWNEFIMGMTLIWVMIFFRESHRFWKPLKHIRSFGPIACCIIALVVQAVGKVDRYGMRLVGSIPKGLPGFTGGWWTPMDGPTAADLFPVAIVVMFVDLLESTSIARAMARKNGYELHYTREIIGLGLANFAGAMSNCYTTTGSFSRTAVNNNAGAKSPLSQFVTSWVVGFVLIFLTTVFEKLPMNVLGAIIVVSVASLFEWEQAIYLWRVNKLDLLCWLASFVGVLFYSVEIGLAIAVGLALLLAMYNMAFPHVAVLGQVKGTTFHRNVKQFPNARLTPGLLEFRVDAPLYYANVNFVQDKLEKLVKYYDSWASQRGVGSLRYIVWDLTPVLYADSMGLHLLEDIVLWARTKGLTLLLANPSKRLAHDWVAISFTDLLGHDHLFLNTHQAVQWARGQLAEQGLPLNLTSYDEDASLDSGTPRSKDLDLVKAKHAAAKI